MAQLSFKLLDLTLQRMHLARELLARLCECLGEKPALLLDQRVEFLLCE